jgi:hypothetical protein
VRFHAQAPEWRNTRPRFMDTDRHGYSTGSTVRPVSRFCERFDPMPNAHGTDPLARPRPIHSPSTRRRITEHRVPRHDRGETRATHDRFEEHVHHDSRRRLTPDATPTVHGADHFEHTLDDTGRWHPPTTSRSSNTPDPRFWSLLRPVPQQPSSFAFISAL